MSNQSLVNAAEGAEAGWEARTIALDVGGGLYALRDQIMREVGPEFTADIFYRAGSAGAGALMAAITRQYADADAPERLAAALARLSAAGYGRFSLESGRGGEEVRIRVEGSPEGELLRDRAGWSGYACDYLRGLLRGVVESLPPSIEYPTGMLECAEMSCLANGDPDCRFLVATADYLAASGYRKSDLSHSSVRETLLRLNRQLEDVLEAAKRDALTGLFNRAHFESVLRGKIENAKRRTDTLAVAMIDLDGFKQVNDGMGHAMGDLALRQVGRLLGAQARDTDVVARYGGDEFAWLMPGTSMEAAVAVADRIRRLVQEMRRELNLPISLSVGIASCPEDAANISDLIDFADVAMYQAKGAGGDQVCRFLAAEDASRVPQQRRRVPPPPAAREPSTAQDSSADDLADDELPRLDLGD